jgi:hypothetical protein
MWLTRVVESHGSTERYFFECKVCGAQTVLAAHEAANEGLEDRL